MEKKAKLQAYCDLLLKWNKTHSLTACKDAACVFEYIEDSIYPIPHLAPHTNALDIGSGNGFPAIPLAIMLPETAFTLCESNAKKASFLNFAAQNLALANVTVINKRVEDLEGSFDLITSRAVGKVELLHRISSHLYAKAYELLLYKGQNYKNEIQSTDDFKAVEHGNRVYLIYNGAPK